MRGARLEADQVERGKCCYCGRETFCRKIEAHVGHTYPDHDSPDHQCLICAKCDGREPT